MRVEHGLFRGRELGVGTAPARGCGRNERDRLHDPVVAGTAHGLPVERLLKHELGLIERSFAFGERRLEGFGVERRQRVADGDRVTDRDVHLRDRARDRERDRRLRHGLDGRDGVEDLVDGPRRHLRGAIARAGIGIGAGHRRAAREHDGDDDAERDEAAASPFGGRCGEGGERIEGIGVE